MVDLTAEKREIRAEILTSWAGDGKVDETAFHPKLADDQKIPHWNDETGQKTSVSVGKQEISINETFSATVNIPTEAVGWDVRLIMANNELSKVISGSIYKIKNNTIMFSKTADPKKGMRFEIDYRKPQAPITPYIIKIECSKEEWPKILANPEYGESAVIWSKEIPKNDLIEKPAISSRIIRAQ